MEKRTIKQVIIMAIVALIIALVADFRFSQNRQSLIVNKREVGQGDTQIMYQVKDSATGEKYLYELTVEEKKISEAEAKELFKNARMEIDRTIFYEGEDAEHVLNGLLLKKRYQGGKVRVTWDYSNWDLLSEDGDVIGEQLSELGELLLIEATMKVQEYEEIYQFQICILPRERSQKEQFLRDVEKEIQQDDTQITLPQEVEGAKITWVLSQESYFWKVLLFELVIGVLIYLSIVEKRRKAQQERRRLLKTEYCIFVNKFAVLLGAGMPAKQVWYNISAKYIDERKKLHVKKHPLYEELLITKNELLDGETETIAYQNFGNRIQLASYSRFVRLLIQSNARGVHGISKLLAQESQTAFEERIHMARKLGEEASTKLLFPLVGMMVVVFLIVMAPAVIEFLG